ncbi:MAG: hypothetical protein SGPRY_000400 [Prymnesium sp.]
MSERFRLHSSDSLILKHAGRPPWSINQILLHDELAQADKMVAVLEKALHLRNQEYAALWHHTEALASELRWTRSELARARATIHSTSGMLAEKELLQQEMSDRENRARCETLAAAQEYHDAIQAHDSQLHRVVRELQTERETRVRLQREAEESQRQTQTVKAQLKAQEEELEESMKALDSWRGKERSWRQERLEMQAQKKRQSRPLIAQREKLEDDHAALVKENQRTRSRIESQSTPSAAQTSRSRISERSSPYASANNQSVSDSPP